MLQAIDCYVGVTILYEGVAQLSLKVCLLKNSDSNNTADNQQATTAVRPYSAIGSTAGTGSAAVDLPPAMACPIKGRKIASMMAMADPAKAFPASEKTRFDTFFLPR